MGVLVTKKPCPFCGARGRALAIEFEGWEPICKVECTNCGVMGPESVVMGEEVFETTNKTLAIKAWNQRSDAA